MKDLKPLIRLNQREVDQRRRVLVQLQEAQAQLEEERAKFELHVEQERHLAASDLTLADAYRSYLPRVKDIRAQFARSAATLKLEIAKAEEAVAEAFRELKKFEQVQEQRDQAAKEARRYRETQMFDEVASIRFARQHAGEGDEEAAEG